MVRFMSETELDIDSAFVTCHTQDWLAAPNLINIKKKYDRRWALTIYCTDIGHGGSIVYQEQSAKTRSLKTKTIVLADKVNDLPGS